MQKIVVSWIEDGGDECGKHLIIKCCCYSSISRFRVDLENAICIHVDRRIAYNQAMEQWNALAAKVPVSDWKNWTKKNRCQAFPSPAFELGGINWNLANFVRGVAIEGGSLYAFDYSVEMPRIQKLNKWFEEQMENGNVEI